MYGPRLNKRGFPFGGSFFIFGGSFEKFGGTTTYASKLTSAYFALKSVLLIANVATLYTYHITNQKIL